MTRVLRVLLGGIYGFFFAPALGFVTGLFFGMGTLDLPAPPGLGAAIWGATLYTYLMGWVTAVGGMIIATLWVVLRSTLLGGDRKRGPDKLSTLMARPIPIMALRNAPWFALVSSVVTCRDSCGRLPLLQRRYRLKPARSGPSSREMSPAEHTTNRGELTRQCVSVPSPSRRTAASTSETTHCQSSRSFANPVNERGRPIFARIWRGRGRREPGENASKACPR
jgi:hypothetical protein